MWLALLGAAGSCDSRDGYAEVPIVIIVLVLGPSIKALGIEAIAIHLFVFYGGVLSNIRRPLRRFRGGDRQVATRTRTAVSATVTALSGFVIPFFFVFDTSLLLVDGFEWTALLTQVRKLGFPMDAAVIGFPSRLYSSPGAVRCRVRCLLISSIRSLRVWARSLHRIYRTADDSQEIRGRTHFNERLMLQSPNQADVAATNNSERRRKVKTKRYVSLMAGLASTAAMLGLSTTVNADVFLKFDSYQPTATAGQMGIAFVTAVEKDTDIKIQVSTGKAATKAALDSAAVSRPVLLITRHQLLYGKRCRDV